LAAPSAEAGTANLAPWAQTASRVPEPPASTHSAAKPPARWRVVHAGTDAGGLKPKLQKALQPSTVETVVEIDSAVRHVKTRCGPKRQPKN